jgi:hypothetical protein
MFLLRNKNMLIVTIKIILNYYNVNITLKQLAVLNFFSHSLQPKFLTSLWEVKCTTKFGFEVNDLPQV